MTEVLDFGFSKEWNMITMNPRKYYSNILITSFSEKSNCHCFYFFIFIYIFFIFNTV